MESDKRSLAELRAEVKNIRKELYKPISRSKKADLVAEIERHKGITSSSSTKEEKPTKEEKRSKPTKTEPKKAEPKKEESKKVKEPKKESKTKETKSKDKKKD